ncbi:MAG: insulinase family protein [Bryobacterales bacterium]|nr:insulinase family protein [Bryobacterales bacterium]MBV9401491.1 insulinase family protein [Bryobacterales bacterium]
MRKTAAFVLVSGLFCFTLSAQTKVTSVEGITEYRLDNGLRVLLFPDNSKPTVTVNVTYLVGSRNEGYGETGMAHLLEHMLFKGTQKHGEILAELTARGAQSNGSTSFDRTNYFETLAATGENLKWAIDMEADRMVNSRVAKKDLDSEMTVVRNEFENGENSPPRILEERVYSTAYLWHAYGHSPIGSRADIERVPIENLQAFYRKYYQPDDAVLVIAGKFDPTQTLKWVNDAFGAIPKPARQLTSTYTQEPVQDGERDVVLRRVGEEQLLMMAYHIPAGAHPDAAALELLAGIMAEQPSGRLYKGLVDSKKAVSTSAENDQYHDPGLFIFNARLRKDADLPDAEKTMLSVIDGVAKEAPSKEEVDRARARTLKNIELMLNNSGRVGLNLSEWAAMGDWRLLFQFRDRIEKVTPEDVARVARQYLVASNRTVGRFVPEAAPVRAEIPATPDIEASLKDYKGKAEMEAGEAFDPSPANIEARARRITLPGGMKLVLLPKKTRGGTVNAVLDVHFGDEKSVFGKGFAAQMAGSLLIRGTEKHNRQQIQDELDRLKARINVAGSSTGANAGIDTVRATFPDALRLAAEILREPAFPETEFEQIRQANIQRIEASKTDPQQIALLQLYRHLSPYPAGDPRAVLTPDENIDGLKKVTLDEAKKFYADFYGASNAELAVVGDFDPDQIQKLAAELFGNWKSPAPYKQVTQTWQKLEAVSQTIETPDKTNAVFVLGNTLAMNQDDPDYPTMVIVNLLTGGDPKSRLWSRVREKEGLSYGVQTAFSADEQDKYARLLGLAICAPQNVLKVESAFKEELAKIVSQGFTNDEVEVAKKALLEQQQLGRSQDASLARTLAIQAHYGWTMKRTEEHENMVAGLTQTQINAAAKKYIDPSGLSIYKAGDFKKAGITQ